VDRFNQDWKTTSGKICAANATGENCIANPRPAPFMVNEDDRTRRMAGNMPYFELGLA